jgi:hypothetical protein
MSSLRERDIAAAAWERELDMLDGQISNSEIRYLKDGFRYGFFTLPGNISLRVPPAYVKNYSSCFDTLAKPLVDQQVAKEVRLSRYLVVSSRPYRVNALGAIVETKYDYSQIPQSSSLPLPILLSPPRKTKVRIITDCSKPTNNAINDFIPSNPFHYENVDTAISFLKSMPGAYMAVVDISEAYRAVPLNPSEWRYYGMEWEGQYLVDTRLPFGCRTAPWIFTRIGRAIKAMMKVRGYDGVVVYLDDFFIIAPTQEECSSMLATLLWLLRTLGFTPNNTKLQLPAQQVVFLGVLFDSSNMQLRLSEEKLAQTLQLIVDAQRRRKMTLKDMQALVGKLNWVCGVVYGGRTFLRRLIDLMKHTRRRSHLIRLTKSAHEDLQWWADFLPTFNGQRYILRDQVKEDLATDASGELGMGAVFRDDWFSLPFPHHIYWGSDVTQPAHINVKELYAILESARRWGWQWTNNLVILRCDNQAVVGAVNKGSSQSPVIMALLRELFWLSATLNFRVKAEWLPGVHNVFADLLSRYRVHEFLEQFYGHNAITYASSSSLSSMTTNTYGPSDLILDSAHVSPLSRSKLSGISNRLCVNSSLSSSQSSVSVFGIPATQCGALLTSLEGIAKEGIG